MVVDWEQETGLLMTSGDVRIIRIWDTDREMKVQVTPACLSQHLSLPEPQSTWDCCVRSCQLLEPLLPCFPALGSRSQVKKTMQILRDCVRALLQAAVLCWVGTNVWGS